MSRRRSIAAVCLTAFALQLFVVPAVAQRKRPNIVLVMADDQGWGDMAYNGHPHLKTPNFDEAAATGLQFNRFYAAAPVCSPTRASVLTGRHPNRMGVFKWGYPMRPQEITIAEVLRDNGYTTAHFGKWHLGSVRHDSGATPGKNGFDHWVSTPNFYDNDPVLCDNGVAKPFQGESSMIAAELATEWITEQAKQDAPFFAVVWFGSPHSPHRAAEEDRAHYKDLFPNDPEKLRNRKINFLGEVTGMDRAYGKIRKSLADLKISENTILWYTSDNGALKQVGATGGFRAHKGKVYEGGLLVPSILQWPARIKSPFKTSVCGNTCDIFPTLLEFAGIEMAADRPMDGISLASLTNPNSANELMQFRPTPMGFWDYTAKGRSVPADQLMRAMLAAQKEGNQLSASKADVNADRLPEMKLETDRFPGHSAWNKENWKLHRIEKPANQKAVKYELYNLADDPYETKNIINDHAELADQMKLELQLWLASVARSYNGEDYR